MKTIIMPLSHMKTISIAMFEISEQKQTFSFIFIPSHSERLGMFFCCPSPKSPWQASLSARATNTISHQNRSFSLLLWILCWFGRYLQRTDQSTSGSAFSYSVFLREWMCYCVRMENNQPYRGVCVSYTLWKSLQHICWGWGWITSIGIEFIAAVIAFEQ